jgi:hypothetical protein
MAQTEKYDDLVLGSGAGGKLLAWHLAKGRMGPAWFVSHNKSRWPTSF